MANTTTYDKNNIVIVPDGSTDWVFDSDLSFSPSRGSGIIVYSLQFNPSAVNDRLIVRNRNGVKVFDATAVTTADPIIKYWPHGKLMQLKITESECTFDTATSCLIMIDYE